jgi:L-threonylcarbamoyladenylate synthase
VAKRDLLAVFNQGGVIAYPTEAVFGLGCDPESDSALQRLLNVKNRPVEKGLILLAGDFSQLLPYIDVAQLSKQTSAKLAENWPEGVTLLIPKNKSISKLLTGKFDSIAVRVTRQVDVVALCKQTNKPIVSTSANLSGKEPARTWQTLDPELVNKIDFIIEGETLGRTSPSKIIDVLTGSIIRQ